MKHTETLRVEGWPDVASPLNLVERSRPASGAAFTGSAGAPVLERAFVGAAPSPSTWSSIGGRIALALAALLLLAGIGKVAAAAASRARDAEARAAPALAATTAPALPSPPPPPPPLTLAALATPTPAVALSEPPPGGSARATAEDPVYINHAGIAELRRLPGAGARRAEAILALRQRMGRFQRVEDLLRVKGIGRATVRRWRPLIRLDAPIPKALADGGAPASAPAER